jgi:hypothetical protein
MPVLPEHELAGVDEQDGDREKPEYDAHEDDVAHAGGVPRSGPREKPFDATSTANRAVLTFR